MSEIIYHPTAAWTKQSRIARLIEKLKLSSVEELLQKSQEEIEWFWETALEDLGVSWTKKYTKILSAGLPFPQWAEAGRLNPTELCIDRLLRKDPKRIAAIFEADEEAPAQSWTFEDLARESSYIAQLLMEAGAKKGDRVALLMPMSLEMLACFFGVWRAGLSVVPIFSGYGEEAVVSRIQEAHIRFAFVQSRTTRRGKEIPVARSLQKWKEQCPHLEKVFECERSEFLKGHLSQKILPAVDYAAEEECMILFTSGTTGKPKGCVHTAFGVIATTAKELGYAFDVQEKDVFFWYTDIGWMMGPWELIGSLQLGASVVLYEGVPNYPDPDRLWRILSEHQVTHLGISPTAIRLLKKEETGFLDQTEFSKLRILGSTGEPWDEESWHWFFNKVGKSVCPIINISGGTEIMGCLLSPNPLSPLKPTTLYGPALACKLGIWSEEGKEVSEGIGHLVCLSPIPSMTKGFLNSRERYLETYFEKFGQQVWYHGDWAYRDKENFWFLKGRSDDTIKVAGKRVGPNEFESLLMEDKRVQEAAAVGIPHEIKGESVVCFVVLKKQTELSLEKLSGELRVHLQEKMGKALAPEKIYFVESLPKTRSGKILRAIIKKIALNESFDQDSAENPLSYDHIRRAL